jgi:hypothetical protein
LLLSVFSTLISFLILGVAETKFWIFFSRILDGLIGGNISLAHAYITGLFLILLDIFLLKITSISTEIDIIINGIINKLIGSNISFEMCICIRFCFNVIFYFLK